MFKEKIARAENVYGTGTITFSSLSLENGVQYSDPFTISNNDGDVATITFSGGGNDGKYYTTGTGIRTYAGGAITVTAKQGNITSASFTWDSSNKPTSNVANIGTYNYNDGTWAGNSNSFTLTRPSGSGHWRLQSVSVTTASSQQGGGNSSSESSSESSSPATPSYTVTFNSNGGSSVANQSVTEGNQAEQPSAPTKNGYIFSEWVYDDDGDNGTPMVPWSFTTAVNTDVTLYATWTKTDVVPLNTSFVNNQYYRVSGEITANTSNKNYYLQDANGAILVYTSESFTVGNSVSFLASYTTYSNMPELQNVSEIEVTNDNTSIETAPLTSASLVTDANKGKYVSLSCLKSLGQGNFTDGTTEILVSKASGLDFTFEDNHYYNLTGVINRNGNTIKVIATTADEFTSYVVTFEEDNGNPATSSRLPSGSLVAKPADPSKAGKEFDCWVYDDDGDNGTPMVEWVFASQTITSNVTLVAKWNNVANVMDAYIDSFEGLESKAKLSVGYSFGHLQNSQTIDVEFNDAALPTGWTGTTGGVYSATGWQSFRTGGQNIVSPRFASQSSVQFSLSAYTNNTNSGKSSSISFIGLDAYGDEIDGCTWTSDNLNDRTTGVDNKYQLEGTINGNGISQLKISFTKSGGGNVAFKDLSYTIHPLEFALEQTESKNNVSLQFGGTISKDLYDGIMEEKPSAVFGMIYGYKNAMDAQGHNLSYYIDEINAGHATLGTYSEFLKANICTPARVNANGEADNDGNYYQFGVSLNNVTDENMGKVIVAAAYVIFDSQAYIMTESTYSVKTIAAEYLEGNTASYAEHLDMLSWLSTYGE